MTHPIFDLSPKFPPMQIQDSYVPSTRPFKSYTIPQALPFPSLLFLSPPPLPPIQKRHNSKPIHVSTHARIRPPSPTFTHLHLLIQQRKKAKCFQPISLSTLLLYPTLEPRSTPPSPPTSRRLHYPTLYQPIAPSAIHSATKAEV